NGGRESSSVLSHLRRQSRSSAYSSKHSGKCSSLIRSNMAGSRTLACFTNSSGGSIFSSSRQCTAITSSLPFPVSLSLMSQLLSLGISLLHSRRVLPIKTPTFAGKFLGHRHTAHGGKFSVHI